MVVDIHNCPKEMGFVRQTFGQWFKTCLVLSNQDQLVAGTLPPLDPTVEPTLVMNRQQGNLSPQI